MDVVYLVRRGSRNDELRMSLRSLVNLPHDRVWFVGSLPPWADVEFIKGNPSTQKSVNVFTNVLRACQHPEVSERFVMMNDDFYCLTEPDLSPRYRCTLAEHLAKVSQRRDPWGHSLRHTEDWLDVQGLSNALSFELHRPLLVDKEAMRYALEWVGEFGFPTPPQWRTVYGNLFTPDAEQTDDCRLRTWGDPAEAMTWPVMSTSDATFPMVREALAERFPIPSPYERIEAVA